MGIDPDEFERHANRVENAFSDEIAFRNVISRKYYHAFHLVRENGDSDPDSNFTQTGHDHKEAPSFLKKKGQKQLANLLMRMRIARNNADYELDKTIDKNDLRHLNQRHQQFVNQIQYCPFFK